MNPALSGGCSVDAVVTVKTGAHLNTGTLTLANAQSANESPTATLTVTDAGSQVNVSAGRDNRT